MSKDALQVAGAIVSGTSDPAVLLDRDLGMVAYSASYPGLAGFRRRQLLNAIRDGASTFDFVAAADAEEAKKTALACMESRKAMHFAEETVSNQNGDELTVILSYLPVFDGDDVVGVIQNFRDVSAEARMQGRYKILLGRERERAESLEQEVEKRTSELTSALEEVTRLSRVDPLTGLLNRRAFTELAEQAFKVAKRHGRSIGLLLGDIDFFKRVNDDYGHMIGDQILVSVAKAMVDAVRDSDAVARFGGEEFVVLLTETERDAIPVIGERVRQLVEKIRNPDGPESDWPLPAISLGMAVFPDHGESLDDLVSNADKALYRAKETGRNRIVMYKEGDFEEEEGTGNLLTPVLVVGSSRVEVFADALGDTYEFTAVDDVEEALQKGKEADFEVLLVDCAKAEDGVEYLRQSQRHCPESLRVLVIDNKDVFTEIRGSNLARIDSFLLREEAAEHIGSAIDDGLARREQDKQKLIMQSRSVRQLYSSRVKELEELIEDRALEFAYQPIVHPSTGKVYAFEALCRAKHPIFRNPQVLFDAAVQSGILWELGRAVREISVKALDTLPSHIKLFMNLHPAEIEDPELANFRDSDIGKRIVFEITERASIPDYGRFRKIISGLSKNGYQFAIDDLGAGYAGLNAVALLSPEYIKIDMAMVRGIHLAPQRAKLIRRIVDFANDVEISLVAEGIETKEEAEVIQSLGCHLTQGYFYGRPKVGMPDGKL